MQILHFWCPYLVYARDQLGLPRWLSGIEFTYEAGDLSSIPGLERDHEEINGNLLQCSFLGNPMDRRPWWASIHGLKKESTTTQCLNCQHQETYSHIHTHTHTQTHTHTHTHPNQTVSRELK